MKKIKFSVICPVFNNDKYVDDCIKSIIAQSFSNWELILINDGSTDNSRLICENYSLNDKRIIVINQNNQGPYQSRINGIKAATGDYVLFLDSDDFLLKDALDVLFDNVVSTKKMADVLLFNFVKDTNAKYDESLFVYKESIIDDSSKILDYVFCKNNIGNLCRFCVKAALFDNIDLTSSNISRYTEDALFLSNILMVSNKMKVLPNQLYYYRKNANSVTHTLTPNDKFDRFENYNYILQSIYQLSGSLFLSDDNASLYSWMPISYIVSSKKDSYSIFKKRCTRIRDSFIFEHICKTNRGISKLRSFIISLLEKKMFLLLRISLCVLRAK